MKKYILLISLFFVMPSFAQNYGYLDTIAQNLPLNQALTKEQAVENLTQNASTPTEKARVLASFIAFQVEKNGFYTQVVDKASMNNQPAPAPFPNDVFKTRIGSPLEFAELYHDLLNLAGIENIIITGYAGQSVKLSDNPKAKVKSITRNLNKLTGQSNYFLQRYEGAWNALKINNGWHLVDTYWMINGTYEPYRNFSRQKMINLLNKRTKYPPALPTLTKNKSLNNTYFFARPTLFIKTHYPIEPNWQLLPIPTTWSSFINR